MDSLSNIDLGTMASEMGAMQMTHELMLIGAICSIVAGVVVGMFGLKISRLLSALAGLAVGTVVGCAAAALLGLAETTFVIVVLACAAVFAISGVFLRKAGIFLWILFSVTGVFGMLLSGIGKVGFIIGFVLGLVLAILAIKFFDPLVMISTSIIGASAISSGVLVSMPCALQSSTTRFINRLICSVLYVLLP